MKAAQELAEWAAACTPTEVEWVRALLAAKRAELRMQAEALGAYLRDESAEGMVDQSSATIGPRRFISACRGGKIAGAMRVGRKWLAPKVAYEKYLTEFEPTASKPKESRRDVAAELERELRVVGGSR